MTKKAPFPPKVGDVFHSSPIGNGTPIMSNKPGKYYVRAIVDFDSIEDSKWGYDYWVVFRYYSRHKGWGYKIEHSSVFAFDLYKKVSKR